MFGFKKNKVPPIAASANPPTAAGSGYSEVYVMPEKYRQERGQGGGKGLLIAAIILIAVILLTASYLIYDMMSQVPAPVPPPVIPPQIEVPAIEPPAEIELTATTTPPTEASSTTSPTSTPPQVPASVQPGVDSDSDSLSNSEETVMGTLPTNPDTDGDGYKDGIEVAAGYNPSTPGASLLNESPFISRFTTAFESDNFQLLYPKDWRVSFINSAKQAVIAIPSGESIKVSVKDNALAQSALSWYLQDHPEALVSQLKVAEAGILAGVYAPNGLTAYLTDSARKKFYIFEYMIGQQSELRYSTIFGAMIRSLALVIPPPTATATTSQSCLGYMCVEEPCGPLVSGQNSCLSPTLKSTCYDKTCVSDSDCGSGRICADTTQACWNGNEAAEIVKVCK